MAPPAQVPGSSTKLLFDIGSIYNRTCNLIRTCKRFVGITLGESYVYSYNSSNDARATDSIESEVIELLCHDYIIDLFFDENGIIYLCEHGCTHRYDAATRSTRILQPLSTSNTVISIDPLCTGFYTIISTYQTTEWVFNVRSLTSLSKSAALTFTRKQLSTITEKETNTILDTKRSKKIFESLKPVVICLHSGSFSTDDYSHNSVSIETNLFNRLLGKKEIQLHIKRHSLLVGFPDGQVCVFVYRSSENETPVSISNSSHLICCLHSPVIGIFALSLNSDCFCDCICIIGQNGKVVMLQLSKDNEKLISLTEFYIPKPVLACDINNTILVHCDGKHIYSTTLKTISKNNRETIHSHVCSDLMGITNLKIIYEINDDLVLTVVTTNDGRIMQTNLNLMDRINFKKQMKPVFTKIQNCSEKLLQLLSSEEKRRNILSSLSAACTLLLSGKAADYFECSCLVHSCTIDRCSMAISVKNISPYKLNCGAWSFSCIFKWPLNNLTQEKQNQIVKTQPLTTDFSQGNIFTCHVMIPLNTLTSSWQFPLQLIPYFIVMDTRTVPGKPIALLQLHSFIVTELNVLETCHRAILPSENTLHEKIWNMARQRKSFDLIFEKLLFDSNDNVSTEILCTEEISLQHLIPGLRESPDSSSVELFWRGHRIGFVIVKDGISCKIQLNCDNLGLLAKLRSSVISKLQELRLKRTNEIEFITLPQSAIQSHLEVTSLMNSFYSMNVSQQLQCLMQLYYELRNKISSKLPLIINNTS